MSSASLSRTYERLASGLRIVRAADDAAGLGVASALRTDSRVYSQGIRNLNDGISYLNITQGAIEAMKNVLLRSRELATHASNGVLTDRQRAALNSELQALSEEYNRILGTTEFNGRKIFDSANASVEVQCGYSSRESIAAHVGIETTGSGSPTNGPGTAAGSTNSAGVQGNNTSGSGYHTVNRSVALSGDGRYLAFTSSGTNLVGGDSNGQLDIFLKDNETGQTTLISSNSAGVQGNNWSDSVVISADGRFVAFESLASNLIAGDGNSATDVFLKDTQTGQTTLVSSGSGGVIGTMSSRVGGMSADGRYVVFESSATNLVAGDGNNRSDIFVKDTQTGQTVLASSSSAGVIGNDNSTEAAISADGKFVIFRSRATNLVGGDSNLRDDIFVKDLSTGTLTRVNTTSAGAQALIDHSWGGVLSADGRYAAFTCEDDLSGSGSVLQQVYVKDTQTGQTTLVSSSAAGTPGNFFADRASISADGRYVAFQAGSTNLVAGDAGFWDIFVKDRQTGQVVIASVNNAGTQGNSVASVNWISISADGKKVAYDTPATNLFAGDGNGTADVVVSNNSLMMSTAQVGFLASLTPLAGVSTATKSQALLAQDSLDDYLDELLAAEGTVGASLNRFQIAASTLFVRTENLEAAASRIMDADTADESAALTRQRIVQDAASAVLTHANQDAVIALRLLKF